MSHHSLPTSARLVGSQAFAMLKGGSESIHSTSDLATEESISNGTDGPTYPLDVYAPLIPNPVPLTEITVMSCFPLLIANCKPLTTPEKDSRLGPWVRVDRPLDPDTAQSRSHEKGDLFGSLALADLFNGLVGSFEAKYLFYRRSRRSDVPRVVDLKLVETGSDKRPIGGNFTGWHRIKADLRSTFLHILETSSSMHLYYKTVGGTSQDRIGEDGTPMSEATSADGKLDPITELDVTYGPGPVWPGFTSLGMVTQAVPSLSRAMVTLSARRKTMPKPSLPVNPLFQKHGTFKILQLADLHFGVQHEKCRNVAWESSKKPCVGDTDTLKLVGKWLDDEKPDLVVFSGDQLNGQTTSWDEKSVIPKYLVPVIERKIEWASIMGNHDSQSGLLTRAQQQALLSRLPYSRSLVGPSALHDGNGAGNYYLKLHSPTPDKMHLFTLYFLDSGELAPRKTMTPWKYAGYDWIRRDQIDWFLEISNKIRKISRPYVPDGASDLPPLWNRTAAIRGTGAMGSGKRQGTHLDKPKALLFTHIPVPEAFATPDKDEAGKEVSWGEYGEKSTVEGAQKKGGIFSAIEAQAGERDVIGLFHGHMHNNNGCRRTKSIWVCFDGGSSFAGYGKAGMERRARVLSITEWGERVDTWHRTESTAGSFEPHVLYEEVRM